MSYLNSNESSEAARSLLQNGYAYLPSIYRIVEENRIFEKYVQQHGMDTNYVKNSDAHLELIQLLDLDRFYTDYLKPCLRDVYGNKIDADDKYFISRFVNGGDSKEAFRGHFDSHTLTVVLPVKINQNTLHEVGELIAFPKARREPTNELINLVQKIIWKRHCSAVAFEKLRKTKDHIVENFHSYKPLMFLGKTTFHGNNIVSKSSGYRLSFLCHYVDTSGNGGVGGIIRYLRNR